MKNSRLKQKNRRTIRVRSTLFGTKIQPKITIFRSNRYIYAQAVDNEKKITIVASSSLEIKKKKKETKTTKTEDARLVGLELAKKLIKKGIKKGVYDRGSNAYLGRVKALAEGLREGGIQI